MTASLFLPIKDNYYHKINIIQTTIRRTKPEREGGGRSIHFTIGKN